MTESLFDLWLRAPMRTPSALNHSLHRLWDSKSPVRLGTGRVERVTRIELAPSAWKAEALPLSYTRIASATRASATRTL